MAGAAGAGAGAVAADAAALAEPSSSRSAFEWPELTAGIAWRRRSALRLERFVAENRADLARCGRGAARSPRCDGLRREMASIIYGRPDAERERVAYTA